MRWAARSGVLVWSLLGFYLGAHVGDIAALAHDFGMVGAAVAAAVIAAVAWLKWPRGRQHGRMG